MSHTSPPESDPHFDLDLSIDVNHRELLFEAIALAHRLVPEYPPRDAPYIAVDRTFESDAYTITEHVALTAHLYRDFGFQSTLVNEVTGIYAADDAEEFAQTMGEEVLKHVANLVFEGHIDWIHASGHWENTLRPDSPPYLTVSSIGEPPSIPYIEDLFAMMVRTAREARADGQDRTDAIEEAYAAVQDQLPAGIVGSAAILQYVEQVFAPNPHEYVIDIKIRETESWDAAVHLVVGNAIRAGIGYHLDK